MNTGLELFVLTWGESKGYRLLNLKSSWNFSPSYSVPGAPSMSTIHLKRKATSFIHITQNNKSTFNFKLWEAKIPAVLISNVSYQQYSNHVIKSCKIEQFTPTFNIQLGYEANLVLLLDPYKKMWYFIDLMDNTYFPWLQNCADCAMGHWFFSDSTINKT